LLLVQIWEKVLQYVSFLENKHVKKGILQKNTFRENEHLKLKRRIDLLFTRGKSKSYDCIRMVYLFGNEELEAPVQVLFSVPKSLFRRAVDRNLLKRRMREAYRLNKGIIIDRLDAKNTNLMVAFLYISRSIVSYQNIETGMVRLLDGILNQKRN